MKADITPGLRRVLRQLTALFTRGRRDRDMDREMAFHLELLRNEYERSGLPQTEADRAARRRFGSALRFKEQRHDTLNIPLLDDAAQDLRHMARGLRRSPGLAIAVVLTLAVGISLNAVLFSLFNGVLFRAQVDRDPESFARIYLEASGDLQRDTYGNRYMATLEDFEAIRAGTTTLAAVTVSRPATFALDGGQIADLRGRFVSCNYLAAHHRPVLLGRTFVDADCSAPATQPVAVLGQRGWAVGFGSEPSVIGRTIRLNNQAMTVIGVTPDNLVGEPLLPLIYVPYTMQPVLLSGNYFRDSPSQLAWLDLSGRLNSGTAVADVQNELNVIMKSIDREHPGRRTNVVVTHGALMSAPGLATRGSIIIGLALGSTMLVLLLVCANVTTLLLARASGRRHEMAIRLSVGASRRRLVRQLMTETLVLAVVAAAISVGLAHVLTRPLAQMLTDQPMGASFNVDWRVLGYTLVVGLLATIAAGLSPARQIARFGHGSEPSRLTDGVRTTARTSSTLIANQISITVMLLAATGFVARAQSQMLNPHLDYDPAAVLVTSIDLARGNSPTGPGAFYESLRPRLEAIPGVAAVALATSPPFGGVSRTSITIEGGDPRIVSSRAVSSQYFHVAGLRLLRGRAFSAIEAERPGEVVSVVVSDVLARTISADLDVLNRRLRLSNGAIVRIVGVVADSSSVRLGEGDGPILYRPLGPSDLTSVSILTQVNGPLGTTLPRVAATLRTINPELPVASETVAETIGRQGRQYGAALAVTSISSGLAIVLSFAGVFGLMTFVATQRTREIGVRMALGAQRREIVELFTSMVWRPLFRGLATGLPLAVVIATVLQRANLLAGVRLTDPWPYGAAVFLTIGTAYLSTLIPAMRAARCEPSRALRVE